MPSFLHRGAVAVAAASLISVMTLVACSSDDSGEKASESSSAVPALPMPITSTALTVPPTGQALQETGVPSPALDPDASLDLEQNDPINSNTDGIVGGEDATASDPAAEMRQNAPLVSAPNAPAPGSDEEQITQLVTQMYDQKTYSDFVNYMPSHQCQELVAQNGVQNPAPLDDTPLEQMPGFDRSQTGIEDVKDIQVNGNRATATVVSKSQGEVLSTQVVFAKENNQWTFCK